MTTATVVNVSTVINRGIGRYQLWLFAICFLISLVDGLDSQIMSVTGPVMARDMQLPAGALGPLLSASQWGSLVGAFGIGFFADRWGRRQTLLACGLVFSIGTLATAWADSFTALFALRVITGLGVGGAVPCYLALAAEYAPENRRAGVVATILGAVPCGGIVAGLLGASLLGNFNWHVVYLVCGIFSLLVSLLVYLSLPESLSFMITRKHDPASIRSVLTKLQPSMSTIPNAKFIIDEEIRQDAPVKHLFTESRGPLTVVLWLAFFVNYLVLLGTLVWTPTLMKQAGMTIAEGSLALMFNNIGSILGIVIAGQILDRYRSALFWVLASVFLGGAIATSLIGYSAPHFLAVCFFSAIAGFCMGSGLSGLYALAAIIYPTFMRSTGIGWSSGFGRVGSSMGPLVVGLMFAASWATPVTLLTLGTGALANVVLILLMGFLMWRRKSSATALASAE
ncbi:AAHS family 4-hydroxybenzoate transporter-like MFS transporter [Beijerinckia sp. GAS462]|nr:MULTISPECIES: MFS transporter [unclassified Beijerinckia]MDH7798309.1 AAHS family 4-hydroxybenzoate transporter-like MFS transporter [Beijerinckia sp. GAS462]SED16528.1 MFS transporter, AAHS family, 4-hydroxybenzoate transporter [Beijerinckia sp. 28-YEA-48]